MERNIGYFVEADEVHTTVEPFEQADYLTCVLFRVVEPSEDYIFEREAALV